jgi:hypothetical protein
VEGAERLRDLPVARHDLLAEIGETFAGRGVGERVHDGVVEPGDDGRRLGSAPPTAFASIG